MMISKTQGVYQIKNITTGEIYIGSAASSFTKRFSRHRIELKDGIHPNPKLQNSYNKYGTDIFEYSILEICDKTLCITREQYYIDTLNPAFNILRIAGSALGHVVSQATKDKISKSTKGIKKLSEEHKKKLSIALMGNTNGRYNKGMPKPPAKDLTRIKLRISALKQWERKKQNEYQRQ